MVKKRLFLWDIDGTLLLTGGAGKAAFERIFLEIYNEPFIWGNTQPDGKTDPLIIRELFTSRLGREPAADEMNTIVTLYNRAMEEEIPRSKKFRLLPHAHETLTKLSHIAGVLMGLATGNFETSAQAKLKRAGLSHFFGFGGFGSDSDDRLTLTRIALTRGLEKCGTKPDELYVVGDTIHDITCGLTIGAKTIAVATGQTTREKLEKAKADWVIDSLEEFFGIPALAAMS